MIPPLLLLIHGSRYTSSYQDLKSKRINKYKLPPQSIYTYYELSQLQIQFECFPLLIPNPSIWKFYRNHSYLSPDTTGNVVT